MRFRIVIVSVAALGLAAAAGRNNVGPPATAPDAVWTSPADSGIAQPALGSDTEIFTAALIAPLLRSGRLSLDDRIGDLLPWYRRDTGALVTVGQLLAHTSGIPDHPDLAAGARPTPGATTRSAVEAWCSGDLVTPPGAMHHDGQADAILLGAIIEEVTGGTYAGAVRGLVMPEMKNEGPPPGGEAALDVAKTTGTGT